MKDLEYIYVYIVFYIFTNTVYNNCQKYIFAKICFEVYLCKILYNMSLFCVWVFLKIHSKHLNIYLNIYFKPRKYIHMSNL